MLGQRWPSIGDALGEGILTSMVRLYRTDCGVCVCVFYLISISLTKILFKESAVLLNLGKPHISLLFGGRPRWFVRIDWGL